MLILAADTQAVNALAFFITLILEQHNRSRSPESNTDNLAFFLVGQVLTCCRALYQEARCAWMVFVVSWCLHTCLGPISACSHSTPAEKAFINSLLLTQQHTTVYWTPYVYRAVGMIILYLEQPQVGGHNLFSLILQENSSQLIIQWALFPWHFT